MGATIKDVAKLAGTSTATVSKVMNGSYSISQETADMINETKRAGGRIVCVGTTSGLM